MIKQVQFTAAFSDTQFGQRLDQALAKLFPNFSRSRIKNWILNGQVNIDGKLVNKPKKKVLGFETVAIKTEIEEDISFESQNIPLNIIYEDEYILIINKPHNLVVHPGIGNLSGTILNALLYYYPAIANVPRAGIVHRLDKDTTGLMVVAKTTIAQIHLVRAIQMREITREYEAIVIGHVTPSKGVVNKPINRHTIKRTHMMVHPMGKHAATHYCVIEHFRAHTYLRLHLETGRRHQIRVHMAHIGHPLVGDPLYGRRLRPTKNISKVLYSVLCNFSRQALHATMLRLYHPITGIEMEWHAAIPKDMANLINTLKTDA